MSVETVDAIEIGTPETNRENNDIENQRIKFEKYLDDNYESCKTTSKIINNI